VAEIESYIANPAFERRDAEFGGHQTRFLVAGEQGKPFVLVHGGGAGADCEGNWADVIERLAPGFRVFAPDMVGFGHSAKPGPDTFAYDQAERESHLAAFIEELDVGPVVLVGNSMGGLTALGVARDRPELVERLILMGSAGIPVPQSDQLQTIMDYDFTVPGMARIVASLTGGRYAPPPGMVDYRHSLSVQPDTRAAYKAITGWMKARGGLQIDEALIQAVKVPTLVVAGKDDGVVPVTCAYRFLELIPQSRGYIMPDCGHWPMIERPAEFTDVIARFATMDLAA
jgi:2-hydroxy-6-oxo-6-(2'-aminophenyl)hexa-2,4-dienoate hydrolase